MVNGGEAHGDLVVFESAIGDGSDWHTCPVSSVAFFRNLNNGQRGHPSSSDILRAFAEVGASDARLVRSNGTVVFAGGAEQAYRAAELLVEMSMWDDIVCVRDVEWIANTLNGMPAAVDLSRVEVTLFDERAVVELPLCGRRCEVIDGGAGYAITLNLIDRVSDGTPVVERALGVRATSRGVSTLQLI